MIADTLGHLAPVGLAELDATAALQTRRDRKYVLDVAECRELLAGLDPATRVLEIDGARTFAYESTYFDTPGLDAFHLAARRRRRRYKVRTRTYVDSGTCFVEVKTRAGRGVTVKERRAHDAGPAELGAADGFVDQRLTAAGVDAAPARALAPTLRSAYRRTTLLLPDGRLTLDTDLVWTVPAGTRHGVSGAGPSGTAVRLDGLVVVETKTGGPGPSSADRILWRSGHRPDRISKYATGLTLLHPGLPDAPWRRMIRHRLATEQIPEGHSRPDPALGTAVTPILPSAHLAARTH
ncbi:polyphosphate polymerase domain-containing protein [Myceligenerans indicum]|uniref:Polyphosphate polymerase domain-containing protein n=1 Tax=Myceligenerans indicum TaxID=2593663 RepID=A0ABS1LRV7_9MICO|nr:polyphosphate polymerase domain-containing protein [Myceligenerans indicum]MBL0888744.1 polyphosphate polymerase domain-containing protein [Myceligenerans indicum]